MTHPATSSERFVTNNATSYQSHMARLIPQNPTALSRRGVPLQFVWGDSVDRFRTLHSDERALKSLRTLFHPGLDQFVTYPKPPDRTTNYWRGPVRKYDIQHTKTLQGGARSFDLQRWQDVVITETWEGGGDRVSMPIAFLITLHQFRTAPLPLGEFIGWQPLDLSDYRHLIIPLSLTVGDQDFDLNEARECLNDPDPEKNFVDRRVSWSFGLVKDPVFVPSNLVAVGV